jgi:hypothetical protein
MVYVSRQLDKESNRAFLKRREVYDVTGKAAEAAKGNGNRICFGLGSKYSR